MWLYSEPSCPDRPFSEELGDAVTNTRIHKILAHDESTGVIPSFKAKLNSHSMCALESSLHTHRIENRYRITNVTNILFII
jgi:hypothetical protein